MQIETRYGIFEAPDAETDLIVSFLARYGEWAWDEVNFIASVTADGDRVLDIGAYLGTFGTGLSLQRQLGKVCFVEANPIVGSMLRKNVQRNVGAPAVVIEALVSGDKDRRVIGRYSNDNLGAASFIKNAKGDIVVPTPECSVTLADLRNEHGPFDLIKLDIEGMEFDVLNSDANYLSSGKTTIWLECNESFRSLFVAELLLSWGVEIYYFAFPAYNPDNFKNDSQPIFPFAFEAGLLVSPKVVPGLIADLTSHGCILQRIEEINDLKNALWRTPRWGMPEWLGASVPELAALAGRGLRGDVYESFLQQDQTNMNQSDGLQYRLYEATINLQRANALALQRLNSLKVESHERGKAEDNLQRAEALALQRLEDLEVERRGLRKAEMELIRYKTLEKERSSELETERQLHKRTELSLHDANSQLSNIPSWLRIASASAAKFLFSNSVFKKKNLSNFLLPGTWTASRAMTNASPAVTEDIKIAISPYFDVEYYLAANPDVRDAKVDPIEHFHVFGWREGRNPSSSFNTNYYLRRNADVAAAGIDPLLHYAWSGAKEGRPISRPLDEWRRQLESAVPIRERAKKWIAIEPVGMINAAAIVKAFHPSKRGTGCILSFSHDDYRENCGGIQNVIGDEEQAFVCAHWNYLHVSPAKPLPMLSDFLPATEFRVRLRLNGKFIGVSTFADFIEAVVCSKTKYKSVTCIVHHLLGHVPELMAELFKALGTAQQLFWVHDFFTICPGYTLMRNDIEFCGAPALNSPACSICCYGAERAAHVMRIQKLIELTSAKVLAPSEVALTTWRRSTGLYHVETLVVPLAWLVPESPSKTNARVTLSKRLKVAHLGARVFHKGWPVFKELAHRFRNDNRYSFFQLGVDRGDLLPSEIRNVSVVVDPDHRDAMIRSARENEIDIVVNWSLWPETFSYVVHEALAAGAFVVARSDMGNVWPAITANAPHQGLGVIDASALFTLFEGSELEKHMSSTAIRSHSLLLGQGTADIILNDRLRSLSEVISHQMNRTKGSKEKSRKKI